ncbi:nitrous oxide reductase family maturation protein NosD [Pseudooceanicola sp.]|uniref:nitrous oxide reductase family maturation protein NosD n=1 Tax=Pseudooceanicola sp. TaxID=1914328 RepID=UPI0035C7719A
MRWLVLIWAILVSVPALAGRVEVTPETFARALAAAEAGDELVLAPGRYAGPVVLTKALTLTGQTGTLLDGGGEGTVIKVDAPGVTLRDLTVTGSGRDNEALDSGIKLTSKATEARVLNNTLTGNLVGIDVHGARDALVKGNRIEGLRLARMNDRGNGIYLWNAPGTVIEDNEIRYGRDGIFVVTSKRNTYRGNLMRDLRFAVHFMYANDSEVSDNVSIGNHFGYGLMYSDRTLLKRNVSINDRDYGVLLNYANQSDIYDNLVSGGANKCVFIYNAHRNLLAENLFKGCEIGVHFTAGSERNAITGNAFVGNRTQVKYVGTRFVEWSHEGRGNFWSDHAAFDLDGDGRADSVYRPNDLMDHILWSQPAAKLLLGSPAVQLVRWSQEQFPATLPGGVVDSHPLTIAPDRALPEPLMQMARAEPAWAQEATHDDTDPLAAH